MLAAGCAVNFVLFALSVLVGSYSFAAVNLVLGAFNLLPFGELDGAQLARLIAMRYLPPQKAQTLLLCLSGIGICVCAVVFISTGSSIGFTFLVTCTYIVILMGKKT